MAPKKKTTTTTSPKNNSDDVPPPSSSSATNNNNTTAGGATIIQPLMTIPAQQTAASLLFGQPQKVSTTTTTMKATGSSSSSSSSYSELSQILENQVTSIDEVITAPAGQKNSFLSSVSASKKISSSETVNLLEGFLKKSSNALSANSFLFSLVILVEKTGSSHGHQLVQSLAQILRSCPPRLEIRGSVVEAARIIFGSNNNNNNITSTTSPETVSSCFRLCLQVLIAAVEAGRHGNVGLLSSALDAIACAQAQNIQPQSMLRDAAQLLTSLGKFATVGSPRLRGLVSAWNAPTLPAKKEAMVVKGGPFKINVAPEFEVKHMTLKL